MGQRSERIGWIGVGRMGFPLVERLLRSGAAVTVYNRTRAKAEPLVPLGATLASSPADLADCDIVFSVVAGPADFRDVMLGENGVLSRDGVRPDVIVDSSTISADASEQVRIVLEGRGGELVAAPISGNGNEVAAGNALFAVSGSQEAVARVAPFLRAMGRGLHHVGEGDSARLVKIAHNLFLGAVIQSLVETTLLIESHGIDRRLYLDFLNESAMGSTFSGYKAPALIDLDWSPTFTTKLLAKDLDLGLDAAASQGVQLPVTAQVRVQVQDTIDAGHADEDFASMLEVQADRSGVSLRATAEA